MFEIIKSYQGLEQTPHRNSITNQELNKLEKRLKLLV
jgi:hypothetical protein